VGFAAVCAWRHVGQGSERFETVSSRNNLQICREGKNLRRERGASNLSIDLVGPFSLDQEARPSFPLICDFTSNIACFTVFSLFVATCVISGVLSWLIIGMRRFAIIGFLSD
jgi:hypothetical protein